MILGYEVTTSGEGDYGQMTWRFSLPRSGSRRYSGEEPGTRSLTLDERDVTITFPSHLSSNSFEDLRGYLEHDEFRLKRRTASPSPRSCGERVGVRGSLGATGLADSPPHPDCFAIRPLPASGAR